MKLNEYNTVDLDKYSFIYDNVILSKNYLEKFFITLVATLGLLGSVYIIASSSNAGNQPEFHNLSLMVASSAQEISLDDDGSKGKFKDYVSIEGKKKAGEKLTFTFKGEREQGARYMADMGDGTRIMIRGSKFKHTYADKGKYTVVIKSTKNAIVTSLAEKEIKIK